MWFWVSFVSQSQLFIIIFIIIIHCKWFVIFRFYHTFLQKFSQIRQTNLQQWNGNLLKLAFWGTSKYWIMRSRSIQQGKNLLLSMLNDTILNFEFVNQSLLKYLIVSKCHLNNYCEFKLFQFSSLLFQLAHFVTCTVL